MFRREAIAPDTWPAVYGLLAPAIERGGDTNARELIDELLTDKAQLWVKRDEGEPVAAAVTTIHADRTLHCQLLGGRGMRHWVDDLIAHVAEQARPLGIERFTMDGRLGWLPVLKAKGWRPKKVLMELELSHVD